MPSRGPAPAAKPAQEPPRALEVVRGPIRSSQRIVVYGPGGVGKTELCSLLVNPLFIDLEDGSKELDVARVCPETWEELRSVLHDQVLLRDYDQIVIDSFTKAEELAVAWTLANVPKQKDGGGEVWVKSIEGYGWGKGYMHVYETFLQLLGDLDAICRAGKSIIATAHECTANVPNPAGEDWIRYEPRLQSPPSGKGSIRHRVKEWCDHLLFVSFDVSVDSDGKAKGAGSRTIYPCEFPTFWAKSRSLTDYIIYSKGDDTLWQTLFS